MRTLLITGACTVALLATSGVACAKPVDLVCVQGGNAATAVHLIVDTDASNIRWYDQQFPASVTDKQVHWQGILNTRPGFGPYIEGTLDLYTGALSYYSKGAVDSQTGQTFAQARIAYTCAKGAKITD
jgi:hypothetical protein